MEYIGSQHASRVRRQGRSKCEEIYTLITSASSRCAVHLSRGGSCGPRAGAGAPGARSRGRAERSRAGPRAAALRRRDEGDFWSLAAFPPSPHRDEQSWLRDDLRLFLCIL